MSEMQSLIWSRSCEEFINLMEEVEREEWSESLRSFLFYFHLRTLQLSRAVFFHIGASQVQQSCNGTQIVIFPIGGTRQNTEAGFAMQTCPDS